jgi:putative flippase GtrA
MNRIKKEIRRFLIAGCSAVGTDLLSYYIMLNFLSHDIAKTISFVLGTIVAYIINKYWTFEKYEKSYKEILKFGFLYTSTLGANVITNKIILQITDMVFLAFLMATGVSTVLNFIGQKWWVFK